MASIYKRGKKVYVIYNGTKEDGRHGQIWEPCENEVVAAARKKEIELAGQIRKEEIELEKKKAALTARLTAIPAAPVPAPPPATAQAADNVLPGQHSDGPSQKPMLFSTLARQWFDVYPLNNWGHGMLDLSESLYKNHIFPYFGGKYIHEVTPLEIEKFMAFLMTKKVKGGNAANKSVAETPCLSSSTRRSIYFLVSQIFDKAVEWQFLAESPVRIAPPKKNGKSRDIWNVDTIHDSLDDIRHPLLHLGIHMSFVCSMRIGECCGLTWDCIDFNRNEIRINKTLQRISKATLEKIPNDDIFHIFPEKQKGSKSVLVLKKPKTKDSERTLYLTGPLKAELLARKSRYDEAKKFIGTDFRDYGMVYSLEDGTPAEPHLLEKWFKQWQKTTTVPLPVTIDFHSMRHSSTTYKLRISNGDIKSVQGDTGHRTANMVVNTYSHMQDANRHFMMKTLEDSFYAKQPEAVPDSLDEIWKLVQNIPPELKNQLIALVAGNAQLESISN